MTSEPIHRALGLTDDELESIRSILGRDPNHLELSMYSVMWSEHCSYKSSRIHLRRLPGDGPGVLVGPGENAGVMDVGDGIAAAVRIESHNHPSYIEPYQGAATGVGGILRDIFTMGARPIALMDPVRVGPLDDPRSRWIAEGAASGVSGYSHAVGVPVVGGELVFDETYRGNPLVNVFCLGTLPTERLVLARASGVGNLAVLLGSATGREGIGGVSVLASAGFDEDTENVDAVDSPVERPTVQAGDPFEEQRLIEACLALLDAGLVVGIQDLGGAGLTCAASETAANAEMGMDFDVESVPRREPGMEPFEVMTSETQERMLAIVTPDGLDEVMAVCGRWDVTAAVVGRVTEPVDGVGRLRILAGWDGDLLADVPAGSLHDEAPLYERPLAEPADLAERRAAAPAEPADATRLLLDLVCDTSWVWSQFDAGLLNNTVQGPGGDAAVLRLRHPDTGADTGRGLAMTTDGNHRWCAVDPRIGTANIVAESILNLACVGARPIAVVNCLNFGNPEYPEVMWQLSESVDGLALACETFELPVVGGNVSLYNETDGVNIDPTPVIGLLGVVDELDRMPPGVTQRDGDVLVLVGVDAHGDAPSLAGSAAAWSTGDRRGELPGFDGAAISRTASVIRGLVADGVLGGVHDVADGGLAVALAEMAIGARIGARITGVPTVSHLFSERPGAVVAAVAPEQLDRVLDTARSADVPATEIGRVGGTILTIGGDGNTLVEVGLSELILAWSDRLPDALGAGTVRA